MQGDKPSIQNLLHEATGHRQRGEDEAARVAYLNILSIEPGHAEANYELGSSAVRAEKFQDALPFLKTALENRPGSAQYWLTYIDALHRSGNLEFARNVLRQGQQRGLKGADVDELAARLSQGAPSETPSYTSGVSLYPKTLKRALELRDSGEYHAAIDWLNKQDTRNASSLALLSHLHILQRDIDSAQAMLEDALEIDASNLAVRLNVARLALVQNELDRALTKAREFAQIAPEELEVHLLLASVYSSLGNAGDASSHLQKAFTIDSECAEAFGIRALLRARERKVEAALADCLLALQYKPHLTQISLLAANLYLQAGKKTDAIETLRRGLKANDENVDLLVMAGELERQESNTQTAIALLEKAVRLAPENYAAWSNYGTALQQEGRTEAAKQALNRALQLNPKLGEVANNLAVIAMQEGQQEQALHYLEQALELLPDRSELMVNKCTLLVELNRFDAALEPALRALELDCNSNTQSNFCTVLQGLPALELNDQLRNYIIRALQEGWTRPGMLAGIVSNVFAQHATVSDFQLLPAAEQRQFFDSIWLETDPSFIEFTDDPLLRALLITTPVVDVALERFLTALRRAYLSMALNLEPDQSNYLYDHFFTALAQQCFINDYVFAISESEQGQVEQLRQAILEELATDSGISSTSLLAYAMYSPLCTIEEIADLSPSSFPDNCTAVLQQQVLEPRSEAGIAKDLAVLTPLQDSVSQLVRSQYEESPYPKWVVSPQIKPAGSVDQYIRQLFPLASFRPLSLKAPSLLIAGCGTGQQSIQTARLFPASPMLAVDLSLASLGYAKRKTEELNISTIQYAQADILELGTLEQRFDVIQSTGVLHHMEDPEAGWAVLLSLLAPGGLMKVALYSDRARSDIKRCQASIAERGYLPTPTDIRKFRQDVCESESGDFNSILAKGDFYSLNTCRDLLFHAQEHLFTIPRIKQFLDEHGLSFLGFQLPSAVIDSYRKQFPDDPAATNLVNWDKFETDNPKTFSSMYQFWVQKN